MDVLISIRPKWCEMILSGKKTIEVRKNRPLLQPPFRCFIYCTKPDKKFQTICGCFVLNSDELYRHPSLGIRYGDSIALMAEDGYSADNFLNGKIVGEFTCAAVQRFSTLIPLGDEQTIAEQEIVDRSCLSIAELRAYERTSKPYGLYGWDIRDAAIYLRPKAISEFVRPGTFERLCRAPQSWCYVEERGVGG